MLISNDHIKSKVFIMGFVALVFVPSSYFLIGIYGTLGAAMATLASELLLLLLYYVATNKFVFKTN
jgi:hypothetical protein